jgi:hypothetical protein
MKDLITAGSIKAEILDVFERGLEMGPTTHYPQLDKHMRIPQGCVLVMTGPGKYEEVMKIIDTSNLKTEIESLIKSMLGIFL